MLGQKRPAATPFFGTKETACFAPLWVADGNEPDELSKTTVVGTTEGEADLGEGNAAGSGLKAIKHANDDDDDDRETGVCRHQG